LVFGASSDAFFVVVMLACSVCSATMFSILEGQRFSYLNVMFSQLLNSVIFVILSCLGRSLKRHLAVEQAEQLPFRAKCVDEIEDVAVPPSDLKEGKCVATWPSDVKEGVALMGVTAPEKFQFVGQCGGSP